MEATQSVLRGLASTEIYLKKVRKIVSKMMQYVITVNQ